MIFLNGEKFIQEAIGSVIAQTYDHWELLLVDDGSTDSSTDFALRCAAQYPGKARYLEHSNHRNRGMSASRNLGIREARGEYIAFLDADDVYLPQKLKEQVSILNSQPAAAMVYGASQHWYSWTGDPEDLQRDITRKLGVQPNTLVEPPVLVVLFLRHKAWTPGTCGVLVRREAIERIGGFDESFQGMFEDQVFFYKLCLRAPVFVESGSWDRYRQHPGSWSQIKRSIGEWDPGPRPSAARAGFLNWLEGYLSQQRVIDKEIWKILRKELWPDRHPILGRLAAALNQAKPLRRV
jgi:glycosyltransferase involved in cell wall biosynthesis